MTTIAEPEVQQVASVIITNHAYEQAAARLSWKKASLDKMAERAYNQGIRHGDAKGKLHRYITKLWFTYETANNIRIYGQNIYFFRDNKLITIYQVPQSLSKFVNANKA